MKPRPRTSIAAILAGLLLTGCSAQSVMFTGASWAAKETYRSVREHTSEQNQSFAEPAHDGLEE